MITSTLIQSHIDCLSSVVITVDCIGLNVTAIYTRCYTTTPDSSMKLNSLELSSLNQRMTARKWQSVSIREVSVSTVWTSTRMTACAQVSVAHYLITTTKYSH